MAYKASGAAYALDVSQSTIPWATLAARGALAGDAVILI